MQGKEAAGAFLRGLRTHRSRLQDHGIVVDLGEVQDVSQDGQQRVSTVQNGLCQLPGAQMTDLLSSR